MYSVKCILSALVVAALTCVTAHATVITGGGSAVNPNPEYDTYVGQAASGSPDTWEITLPNNTYYVTIACGDPSTATGPHYIRLAGDGSTYSTVTALNGTTAANVYRTATNVPVTVSAGKLSLQLGGNSAANRINFIIISETLLHIPPVCGSTSYSSYQDLDHWTYNYWNGSAYAALNTLVSSVWFLNSARPAVQLNGANPGGTSTLWDSVRTYTMPYDDTVNIKGWAVRTGASGSGDGVTLRVYKVDTLGARTEVMTPIEISNTNYTYQNFTISSLSVLAGDKLHFHVDPRGPGCGAGCTSYYDSTQMGAVISSTANGETWSASNGYSSHQGQDNWTYNYYDGSTYTQLNLLTGGVWTLSGARPMVQQGGGNPGGTSPLQDSVRTWTAPNAGSVNISGWAVRTGASGSGDGVTLLIIKEDTFGAKTTLYSQGITNTDYTYQRFSVSAVSVATGDKLHFHIDPRGPSCGAGCTSYYDSTRMDALVQYTVP
jgi:hypothetical protein